MFDKSNSNVIREKMNELMENEKLFITYRNILVSICEAKEKTVNAFAIPVDEWFKQFDAPYVLSEYTDEQNELIVQLKKELVRVSHL